MRCLVTGSCGYVGSVLVPKLLDAGHEVLGLDVMWFGNHLQPHHRLSLIKADIRDIGGECAWLHGCDAIIHLAGIANDPCGELDTKLTWEVNVLATMRLAEAAVKAGVKQFIFASSASVYGIQDNKPVNEDSDKAPVSDYNKTKMCAERILMSYAHKMEIKIIRPATICGVSPRMRLDVIVNLLTAQALQHAEITAHCGEHGAELMRPHCHIEDAADLYCWILGREGHCLFNAGFDNQSVGDTAKLINEQVPSQLNVTPVSDKRSYCVDSSRLLAAGFAPNRSVRDAIQDISKAWRECRIETGPRTINLQWMRAQGLIQE